MPIPQPPLDQRQYSFDIDSWRLNCADDAFRTAILTLENRSARFGRNSAAVEDWLHAQDAVFSNCSSNGKHLPPAAPANSPAWLLRDREYQTAAAQLYSGDSRAAATGFQQIAMDTSSPWHTIAPYLVARVLAREAESAQPDSSDKEYQKAEAQIERILAERRLASIHGMSRALLRRVRVRVEPQIAVRELARAVMQRGDEGSLRQDLWDYTTVLDRFLDDSEVWDDDARKQFDKKAATIPRRDDVTDWIVTIQSKKTSDTAHAVRRWRETRALPWFVAAISRVSGSDPAALELLSAPLAVDADSPAYWSVAFHRNRLRIESRNQAPAKAELDLLFNQPESNLPPSLVNHFRSLRMLAAPDLAGFLNFAPRVPVMVTSQMNEGETPDSFYAGAPNPRTDKLPRWDTDSIKVLNRKTPLSLWVEAAASDHVPGNLRQELVLATFARAALLDDDPTLSALAPSVSKVFPEATKYMAAVQSDPTAEARHFAAIYFLLHYANVRPYLTSGVSWHVPSHRIMDSYVNNWWCAVDSRYGLDWNGNANLAWYTTPRVDVDAGSAAFLQTSSIAQADREFEKLASTRTAPNYLTSHTLKWTREHPADSRNAEALAYAIRAGKYGCVDAQSARFSRDAFQLLQLEYGNSSWARKTPYWFNTFYPQRNQ